MTRKLCYRKDDRAMRSTCRVCAKIAQILLPLQHEWRHVVCCWLGCWYVCKLHWNYKESVSKHIVVIVFSQQALSRHAAIGML